MCDFLGIQYDEAMETPYAADNVSRFAGDGGEKARTHAGDPKLLKFKRIDSTKADGWKKIKLPIKLTESTTRVARHFEYDLPYETDIVTTPMQCHEVPTVEGWANVDRAIRSKAWDSLVFIVPSCLEASMDVVRPLILLAQIVVYQEQIPPIVLLTSGLMPAILPLAAQAPSTSASMACGVSRAVREEESLRLLTVNLLPGVMAPSSAVVAEALRTEDGDDDLAMGSNECKYVPRLRMRTSVSLARPQQSARVDCAVLFTSPTDDSLGGLGLHAARALVRQRCKRILIATSGRSHAASLLSKLSLLPAPRPNLSVTTHDVTAAGWCPLLEAALCTRPKKLALLHTGSTSYTRLLRSMVCSGVEEVYNSKAVGAWKLHEASASLPSSCLLFSTAPLFHAEGELASMVSNAYCDALSSARQSQGLKGVTLQLPLVTQGNAAPVRLLLDPGQIAKCLRSALGPASLSLTILARKPSAWLPQCAAKVWPLHSELVEVVESTADPVSGDGQSGAEGMDSEEELLAAVMALLDELTGERNEAVDVSFTDTGLDSISSLSLISGLRKVAGSDVALTISTIEEHSTPRAIVAYMMSSRAPKQLSTASVAHQTSGFSFSKTSGFLCELEPGAEGATPLIAMYGIQGHPLLNSGGLWLPVRTPLYKLQHALIAEEGFAGYSTFEDETDDVARRLLAFMAGSGFHLIGGSFGALLAHVVATRAVALGGQPRTLILMDPPPPPKFWIRQPTSEAHNRARAWFASCSLHRYPAVQAGFAVPPLPVFDENRDVSDMRAEALDFLTSVTASGAAGRQRFIHEHEIIFQHMGGFQGLAGVDLEPFANISYMFASKRKEFFEHRSYDATLGTAGTTSGLRPVNRVKSDERWQHASYGAEEYRHIEIDGEHIPSIIRCLTGKEKAFHSFMAECLAEL
uniref:Carrier domain-containing protein n=1 Tax=Haptolina brevifila TaxID=156173 RepID=A0A7S2D2W5_9EUKA